MKICCFNNRKKKIVNLSNTQLFRGLEATEIANLLNCHNATEHNYKKVK